MVTVATKVDSWKGLKLNDTGMFVTDIWKTSLSSGRVSSVMEMLAQCLLFVADSVTSCRYVSWSWAPEVTWNKASQGGYCPTFVESAVLKPYKHRNL